MKKYYLLIVMLVFTRTVFAGDAVLSVESPSHRTAMLELYTSEGCSSCPPADKWLSELKKSGISSQQVIPLAFHVTYWDYIGWHDSFASKQYDDRQRLIAQQNASRTIYTPQFVLDGKDFRAYNQFSKQVLDVVSMLSKVQLKISAQRSGKQKIDIELASIASEKDVIKAALYMVIYENDLKSEVEAGENEGEDLHHDYVVRKMFGPFWFDKNKSSVTIRKTLGIDDEWKSKDLNFVAFAQNPQSGEIYQAVKLDLKNLD